MKIRRKRIVLLLTILTIIVSGSLICLYKKSYASSNVKNKIDDLGGEDLPSYFAVNIDGVDVPMAKYPEPSKYAYVGYNCTNNSKLVYNFVHHSAELEEGITDTCTLSYRTTTKYRQGKNLAQKIISLEKETEESPYYQVNSFLGNNEGYRYQGPSEDTPNYICIGTESKSECLANEEYQYRIIGAIHTDYANTLDNYGQSSGYLTKVVSVKSYGPSNRDYEFTTGIAATIENEVYTPLNEATRNMIARAKFAVAGTVSITTGSTVGYGYNISRIEQEAATNQYRNVGLLSATDIAFSALNNVEPDPETEVLYDCLSLSIRTNTSTWKTKCSGNSWIQPNTMLQYSYGASTTKTFMYYHTNRYIASSTSKTATYNYNAVMYLKPETYILSGTGTSEDPYIVRYDKQTEYELYMKENTKEIKFNNSSYEYIPINYTSFVCNGLSDPCDDVDKYTIFKIEKINYSTSGGSVPDASGYAMKLIPNFNYESESLNSEWANSGYNLYINNEGPDGNQNFKDAVVPVYWHTGAIDVPNSYEISELNIYDIKSQERLNKCYTCTKLGYMGKIGLLSLSDLIAPIMAEMPESISSDPILSESTLSLISSTNFYWSILGTIGYPSQLILLTGNKNVGDVYSFNSSMLTMSTVSYGGFYDFTRVSYLNPSVTFNNYEINNGETIFYLN